jgi:hypothetical protein
MQELILPYYIGPAARMIPALFVLKGEFAYIINGPDPVLALQQEIVNFSKMVAGKQAAAAAA